MQRITACASALEAIVGPLASRETIGVKVNSDVANPCRSLPEPVSIQLARFYAHVMRERLAEPATLDLAQHELVVTVTSRGLAATEARQLLQNSLTDALNRAADKQAARGGEALARWYVGWARWFDGLGIDLGAIPDSGSLAWALKQSCGVLKSQLENRLARVIDKVSLTPINLP